MKKNNGPRVLLYDIETRPIEAYVWGLFDQNVGLEQIITDWGVISWSAKWLGDPDSKIMYMDLRGKNKYDDSKILKKLWELIDEADIAITQNGKAFDNKKINARFALLGLQPPSTFRNIDTLVLAKRHFAFTSNKLEFLSSANPNKTTTKLKSKKFPGFLLWKECLLGNLEAWQEMERYNKRDVIALEELYKWLAPWDNSINFSLYNDSTKVVCKCGSTDFTKRGYFYTNAGKFQRYKCNKCGTETRSKENLLSKAKKASLRNGTTR